jgi:hypothetical protein
VTAIRRIERRYGRNSGSSNVDAIARASAIA